MKVLVIMPTYGRIPFLNRALASFLSQTYDDKELVIVNDDKNVEIKCEYPNVTCININKKILLGQKLNIGVNLGFYELFLPTDDDDVMLPNRIENCVSIHKNNSNIELYWNKYSYTIYGNEFSLAGSGANTVSYTRECWLKYGGYLHNKNNGPDQEFRDKVKNKLFLDSENLSDYVYNWGGINYHTSCSDDYSIEQIAYNQLLELNLLNKKYYIEPDFFEYKKFIELKNMYDEKKEPIKIEHIEFAKIKIL